MVVVAVVAAVVAVVVAAVAVTVVSDGWEGGGTMAELCGGTVWGGKCRLVLLSLVGSFPLRLGRVPSGEYFPEGRML